MRFRLSKHLLIAAVLTALLVTGTLVPRVEAQKQGEPLWYSVVTVERVNKPNRQPTRPVKKTQQAALLTLQWHLLERGEGKNREEADPSQAFHNGDQLKLAITVNQTGYLYIVNQPEGKDGVLLFPDLRVNSGRNYVLKDREYIVPSFCPAYKDPEDCWFEMSPPAGTERMIVIFSRDKITTLPNDISQPNPMVKRAIVDQLISSSEQKVKQVTGELAIPRQKAVRYATRVQNINRKDNEELIATIDLRHSE